MTSSNYIIPSQKLERSQAFIFFYHFFFNQKGRHSPRKPQQAISFNLYQTQTKHGQGFIITDQSSFPYVGTQYLNKIWVLLISEERIMAEHRQPTISVLYYLLYEM